MITRDSLIDRLGNDYDYQIFRHFLGFDFKLRKLYPSPFRNDNDPSFNVFCHSKNDKLYFKDFGDTFNGDCFQFVQYLTNLSFIDTVQYIANAFNVEKSDTKFTIINYIKPVNLIDRGFTDITYNPQAFTKYDKEYWQQFGVSSYKLKEYNVSSAASLFIKSYWVADYKPDNPIYVYEVNNRFKVYRPYEVKEKKFRGNWTENDIFGYKQLPSSGEICIISKSPKDVLVLDSFSFPAICGNSENTHFSKKLISHLYTRFDNLLVYNDNDVPGIIHAKRTCEEHNLSYIHNPFGSSKDISDYRKETSHLETENFLNNLIYG